MVKKKRLLASVCPSVRLPGCLPACISSAPTGRSFVEFDIGDFYERLSIKSRFVRIGQQRRPLFMKT